MDENELEDYMQGLERSSEDDEPEFEDLPERDDNEDTV